MTLAAIDAHGQITLPLDWREKHGLKEGDTVTVIETEQGLVIVPEVDDDEDDLTPEEYAILEARLAPYRVDGKFSPEKYASDAEIMDLTELAASFGISEDELEDPA